MQEDKELPGMIRDIMQHLDINQTELAKKIGVNQSTICKALRKPDTIRYRTGKAIERLHTQEVAERSEV